MVEGVAYVVIGSKRGLWRVIEGESVLKERVLVY